MWVLETLETGGQQGTNRKSLIVDHPGRALLAAVSTWLICIGKHSPPLKRRTCRPNSTACFLLISGVRSLCRHLITFRSIPSSQHSPIAASNRPGSHLLKMTDSEVLNPEICRLLRNNTGHPLNTTIIVNLDNALNTEQFPHICDACHVITDLGGCVVIASASPLDALQSAFGETPVHFIADGGRILKVNNGLVTPANDLVNGKWVTPARPLDTLLSASGETIAGGGRISEVNGERVTVTLEEPDIKTAAEKILGLLCSECNTLIYIGESENDREALRWVMEERSGIAIKIAAKTPEETPKEMDAEECVSSGVLVAAAPTYRWFFFIENLMREKFDNPFLSDRRA
jgi:hypothetical protein